MLVVVETVDRHCRTHDEDVKVIVQVATITGLQDHFQIHLNGAS